MSFGNDPFDSLTIPDGTTVEEYDLVTEGNVMIGGQSTVEFGVRAQNILAGERVQFGGSIEAERDCRLDVWCEVAENVLVGKDAYLGERVHIGGQLLVAGDLDIGDDVTVEEGFEANGWIVIRNPVSSLVFYFIILSHLLQVNESEAASEFAQEIAAEAEGDDDDDDDDVMMIVIPRGATVSDDIWQVSTPASIGDDCRLHGNVRAASITVGRNTNLFGSLRAREDINIDQRTRIHGDVTTRDGAVSISAGAQIRGDVVCGDLELHDDAEVYGTIRASGKVNIVHSPAIDE
ncbi:polymer-forming cytoskeletal protein [Haloquadratum walsbyi]|uniref:Putative acyltransferase n=1 Tax=Haloquadratum walsbyi J07HQW2 TaxID=1238425 RepID=U1MWJ5_9EURY|nr:polymer-forming cytoskeletal protein [Haloquadratum walsbyi]ERG94814.1 MAG: putative acyltransferase [Haloquadratum walsbyi J07HQW2]